MLFGFIDTYIKPAVEFTGWALLIMAVVWIVDLIYEAKRAKGIIKFKDPGEVALSFILKVISTVACASGVIFVLIGAYGIILSDVAPTNAYAAIYGNHASVGTSTLLIVMGILTCLKPLNDFPLASMIGLAVAAGAAVVMMLIMNFVDVSLSDLSRTTIIILAVILIAIFVIVAIIAKFWLVGITFVSKIVSLPIVSIIGVGLLLVQGIGLIGFGYSLFG